MSLWKQLFVLLLGIGGCTEEDQSASLPDPVAAPWARPDQRPELDHPFFPAHPGLDDLSLFAQTVAGDTRPDSSHRGAFGIGNGKVFALMGLADPMNTLHGVVGPVYQKGDRFFGDTALQPVVNGALRSFDTESIARPRGTGMVVTRGDVGDLSVWTVDFAASPEPLTPEERPPAVVRWILVKNRGPETVELSLQVIAVDQPGPPDDHLSATLVEDGRTLVYTSWDDAFVSDGDTVALDLGRIGPGQTVQHAIAYVIGVDQPAAITAADTLLAQDPEALTAETIAWWQADSARGTQFELDDPWVLDLIDTTRVMIRVQQTIAGGIAPMSRYTGVWLRDMIGPARFLSRLGLHDDVTQSIDYLQLCHRKRGDIGNACASGLLPEEVSTTPDWDALPPFSGRTAAEGPSYLVMTWAEDVRWTGDTTRLAAAWPYLRRAVMAQSLSDDGLQPWSGDETFRLAMNVALGYPLETPWQDIAWSSNSAMMLIAACEFLADHAAEAGHPEDEPLLRERAARARQGLVDAFLQPDGHFAAALLRDPAEPPVTRPYEDVNLNAIWSGAFSPDDPLANRNLDALYAVAGHADGSVQSTPDPIYDLGVFAEGGATGMAPGFALFNASETGDPSVLGAFDQVLAYASVSGEYAEAILYGDRSPLQPVYDKVGHVGDVSARFRPWEGGIVLDAVVSDLLGAAPVMLDGQATLRLRPRVPNGLDHLLAGPIDAPGARVGLELTWEGGWHAEVTCLGAGPCRVALELPLGVWADVALTLGGDSAGELVRRPRGERMARFEPITLTGGESAAWWVRAQ